MSEVLTQNADGTMYVANTNDGVPDQILGGPASPTVAAPRFYGMRTMKVPLTAADAAAGVVSWQNNLGYDILVSELIIDVTTKSTGASTISAGIAATAVSAANLIDTLDVGTATGTFDNVTDKGTNGKSRGKIVKGAFFTISKASGATAGLVGSAYLSFIPV